MFSYGKSYWLITYYVGDIDMGEGMLVDTHRYTQTFSDMLIHTYECTHRHTYARTNVHTDRDQHTTNTSTNCMIVMIT